MKMFMFKSILTVSLMFISVLFGMQQANEGIHNMKGYQENKFKGAFSFEEAHNGDLEASILGNEVSSHDLENKKQKLEKIKSFNFFSTIGKEVANIVTEITEKIIKIVTT